MKWENREYLNEVMENSKRKKTNGMCVYKEKKEKNYKHFLIE